ncbi:MAG: hypothetical protein A2V66_15550 [Ignavibacteria bacterium RBG_13_36_8]|nr:MAG: hypothetical protein A2V66_15550 [Ignavibacteria bacterium RBG_13_36_8]
MKFLNTRYKDPELLDLERGQVSEFIDDSRWQELKPRAKKIASYVTLQLLLQDGRKIATEGPLYLYKTTYISSDPEVSEKITKNGKTKTLETNNNSENYKIDLYIQRMSNTNQLVAFEVGVPLRQDLTRFCSRKRMSSIRQNSIRSQPILILALAYAIVLNFIQFLPYFGIQINYSDWWFVMLNTFAITSLIWFGYSEIIREGYYAALVELDHTRLLLSLNVHQEVMGKALKKISVKRTLDVFRCQIFYSDTMHLEALNWKPQELAELLKFENKTKIQELTNENTALNAGMEQLKQQLDQTHSHLEAGEKRIRQAMREGFILRGKFEKEDIFQDQKTLFQSIVEAGILKWLFILLFLVVFGYLFIVYLLPMLSGFVFPGMPEISLGWQIIIFACILFGIAFVLLILAAKIFKVT